MINLKNRIIYIIIFVVVIILGLSSRVFSDHLPLFISSHFGDALWASMVYFGCRILFRNKGLFVSVVLSVVFSYSIEFSQLYQADWINDLRSTLLGALILGKGFLSIDLIRYGIGIVCSWVMDRYWISRVNVK